MLVYIVLYHFVIDSVYIEVDLKIGVFHQNTFR